MTFAIAQKFGDRVLILSDSMVTDKSGIDRSTFASYEDNIFLWRLRNIVPGRLKIFIIGRVSIAYAGCSAAALQALRDIFDSFGNAVSSESLLPILADASVRRDVDFLLVSHDDGCQIRKITNGCITSDQDVHWVGNGEIASILSLEVDEEKGREKRAFRLGHTDHKITELAGPSRHLSRAWKNLMLNGELVKYDVGGIAIEVDATCDGHAYSNYSGCYNPETITIGLVGVVPNQYGLADPLYGQYSHCIAPGRYHGLPLLGIWLPEAATGFLHDPLRQDEAIRLDSTDLSSVHAAVDKCYVQHRRSRLKT